MSGDGSARCGTVALRLAVPADVPTLERWDGQPHVIAASGDDDTYDWDVEVRRTVPWQQILVAEEDGRAVGVVVIIDPREEETHYWGDIESGHRAIDIWIGEPADLGRGIGTQMMAQALARCFAAADVHTVLIDPLATNLDAQRFYQRMGFVEVGPRRFGDDDCVVMAVTRERWSG